MSEATGTIQQVSSERGRVLLRKRLPVRYGVPDLRAMMMAEQVYTPRLSGAYLGELLQMAEGVAEERDATEYAANLATFLKVIAEKMPAEKGWNHLAALAFWTARNAAHAWGVSTLGRPLREHNLEWWEFPPFWKTTVPLLKATTRIGMISGERPTTTPDWYIEAPKWFLDARELNVSIEKDALHSLRKLAMAIVAEYFRSVLWSECQVDTDRIIEVHPQLSHYLTSKTKRDGLGRIKLAAYGEEHGRTPGELLSGMMDQIKGKFESLPDWVFLPWMPTLLGLVPGL